MIFSEYIFLVLCFLDILYEIEGLDINCGTRGIDVGVQEEHRELRCLCSSNIGKEFLNK